MLTLRQILRSDPASTPLEEYQRVFAFMNLSKLPRNDKDKKLRYLTLYRARLFGVSSINTAFIVIFVCILISVFAKVERPTPFDYDVASLLWPFAKYQMLYYNKYIPPGDAMMFMAFCSATSAVWLCWIVWRFYHDIIDRGALFSDDIDNIVTKIFAIAATYAVASIVSMWIASWNLSDSESIFSPSIHDSLYVYSAKKCLIISFAYWSAGLASFLLSLSIGNLQKKRDGDFDGRQDGRTR